MSYKTAARRLKGQGQGKGRQHEGWHLRANNSMPTVPPRAAVISPSSPSHDDSLDGSGGVTLSDRKDKDKDKDKEKEKEKDANMKDGTSAPATACPPCLPGPPSSARPRPATTTPSTAAGGITLSDRKDKDKEANKDRDGGAASGSSPTLGTGSGSKPNRRSMTLKGKQPQQQLRDQQQHAHRAAPLQPAFDGVASEYKKLVTSQIVPIRNSGIHLNELKTGTCIFINRISSETIFVIFPGNGTRGPNRFQFCGQALESEED
ncbi:unnamed protein product [Clonostachys byssicola]|uniref:Uncharacterized protein n=1 Tax=Clonostachys byssicola TaxID=160290 RepID=A0A9N9U672_9HYPO|nr:unnamed protein product [Clonostachys byssicola]